VVVEYWVFCVVAEGGADLARVRGVEKIDRLAALWGVVRGRYFVIGGDICEPVECFDEQAPAMERARREHQRTGCLHKVTMNAEL
jgi:hypothetical protein